MKWGCSWKGSAGTGQGWMVPGHWWKQTQTHYWENVNIAKQPYPRPERLRALHAFPVQFQGVRLMNVFLVLIIISCKWLCFCMSQLLRAGNFGCHLHIYILKEKLSNWNGCKKGKGKKSQKLLMECENALERVREKTQLGWVSVPKLRLTWLQCTSTFTGRKHWTLQLSDLEKSHTPRITDWQLKPGKFKLEKKDTNSKENNCVI